MSELWKNGEGTQKNREMKAMKEMKEDRGRRQRVILGGYPQILLACILNDAFGSQICENNVIFKIFENFSIRRDFY